MTYSLTSETTITNVAVLRNNAEFSVHSGQATPVAIQTPVTAPEWRNEIGQQAIRLAVAEVPKAEIQINPAELGPITIKIEMSDKVISIDFSASHTDTRQLLEQSIPHLRDMFEAAGLQIGNASVGQQSANSDTAQSGTQFLQYASTTLPRALVPEPIENLHSGRRNSPLEVDLFA
jgi:flagellar hook-length control protein FliK